MSALASLVTVVPGAWKVADRPAVLTMIGACILFTPLGVLALRFAPPEAIQTGIGIADAPDARRPPGRVARAGGGGTGRAAGVGALAGLTGGSTGLNGPPVILFNLGTRGSRWR
jgi:hypothetical protein